MYGENMVDDNSKKISYPKMTDDEIKKLAEDIYRGLVFTSRHIQNNTDISTVFTPLIFMNEKQLEELKANPPGMLYEYMNNAGNMAINGMPMFLSLRWIDKEDAKKVIDRYNKIIEAVKKA